MFQWTEDQRRRRTAIRDAMDRLRDAVSRRRTISSVIGAIAEVRVRRGRGANGEPLRKLACLVSISFNLTFRFSPSSRPPGAVSGFHGDRRLGAGARLDVAVVREEAEEGQCAAVTVLHNRIGGAR